MLHARQATGNLDWQYSTNPGEPCRHGRQSPAAHAIPGMRPVIAPLPSSAPARLGGHRLLGLLGTGGMVAVYLARCGRHRWPSRPSAPNCCVTPSCGSFRPCGCGSSGGAQPVRDGAARVVAASGLALAGSGVRSRSDARRRRNAARAATRAGRVGPGRRARPRRAGPRRGWRRTPRPQAVQRHPRYRRPHVVDFGIARTVGDTTLTATGQRPGTPGFMSVEQVMKGVLGAESDVFCLGALPVFAVTGRHALFDGNAARADFRIVYEEPDLAMCPACSSPSPRSRSSPPPGMARTTPAAPGRIRCDCCAPTLRPPEVPGGRAPRHSLRLPVVAAR